VNALAHESSAAGWRGQLTLDYRLAQGRTIAHTAHDGPLRVLQPLHPEGPGICHHVVLHPPGGVVAGDELRIDAHLGPGSHALITTPGATRFYRSEGAVALQQAQLRLEAGARLEWLPLETIAYSGCQAHNRVRFELAGDAEMIGWDLLALGLPASQQPYTAGWFRQTLEWPGRWLESARIAAEDAVLLRSAAGWAGHPVLATAWFATGAALPVARRDALLDVARTTIAGHALAPRAGVTSPQPGLLVLRVLAPRVEPAMDLLVRVRAAWREQAWGLAGVAPRIWRT
jgi:urease accessory protein